MTDAKKLTQDEYIALTKECEYVGEYPGSRYVCPVLEERNRLRQGVSVPSNMLLVGTKLWNEQQEIVTAAVDYFRTHNGYHVLEGLVEKYRIRHGIK